MYLHPPTSDAIDIHIRKIQAVNLLASIARMNLTGRVSDQDEACIDEGIDLFTSLKAGKGVFDQPALASGLVNSNVPLGQTEDNHAIALATLEPQIAEMLDVVKALRSGAKLEPEKRQQLRAFLVALATFLQEEMDSSRVMGNTVPLAV